MTDFERVIGLSWMASGLAMLYCHGVMNYERHKETPDREWLARLEGSELPCRICFIWVAIMWNVCRM